MKPLCILSVFACVSLGATVGLATCPTAGWQGEFGAPGITSNQFTPQVNALHVWDLDGSGPIEPVLVIGGAFITAGGSNMIEGHGVYNIVLWDGLRFRGLPGLNGQVLSLEVDNTNILYAGGHFTSTPTGPANSLPRIARFDANMNIWRPLAANGFDAQVNALQIEPSGSIMVGGLFANFAAGGPATRLARWNGVAWSNVTWEYHGSEGAPAPVWSIFDYPDSQFRIHVGMDVPSLASCVRPPSEPATEPPSLQTGPYGGRAHAGLQAQNGRRWAGGTFTQVLDASGFTSWAERIAYCEPGSSTWVQAGAGLNDTVYALASDGNTVYAGGRFTQSGSTILNRIARWDGSAWQPMGSGFDADVFALAFYDGDLYAGGMFGSAEGNYVHGIARWDGDQWRTLGHGSYPIQGNPAVTAIAKFENQIVAGGRFIELGGLDVRRAGRFDGDAWVQIAQGLGDYPHSMVGLDGNLYALGMYDPSQSNNTWYRVQRFSPQGALWVDLGGFNQYFSEAVSFNGQIVIGGEFTASGATPLNYIGISTGNGDWQPLGAGFNSTVRAMTVFDGDLVAGGYFTMSGTTAVNKVARWNAASESWQPMGTGLPGSSSDHTEFLYVHNGELYAGGTFSGYLRRWTGSAWEQVGDPAAFGGCFGGVNALTSYGGDLIVGGNFSCGQNGILRWTGTSYGPMAAGDTGVQNVTNLLVIDGDLWVNGVFSSAGGLPAGGLARWRDDASWVVIEPESVTADLGNDVIFTARSSHGIGNYFWYHNGEPISGGVTFDPVVVIPDVEADDAGEYQCVFATVCGEEPLLAHSNIAQLTVDSGLLPGDMNCDGVVDVGDVAPFALALVDVAAYDTQFPACNHSLGDLDQSGELNGLDAALMTELLLP